MRFLKTITFGVAGLASGTIEPISVSAHKMESNFMQQSTSKQQPTPQWGDSEMNSSEEQQENIHSPQQMQEKIHFLQQDSAQETPQFEAAIKSHRPKKKDSKKKESRVEEVVCPKPGEKKKPEDQRSW
jgi:hypothetical protein